MLVVGFWLLFVVVVVAVGSVQIARVICASVFGQVGYYSAAVFVTFNILGCICVCIYIHIHVDPN